MSYDTMNSDCGHMRVHGHGPRRRRCADCGVTWTMRAKRRGRKSRKRRVALVARTFTRPYPLTERARDSGTNTRVVQQRHAAALRVLTDRPWPHRLPSGDLILVCDALWHTVDGEEWTTYLVGLRAVHGEDIVFLRPILRPGHEAQEQWREIIGTIPKRTRQRIHAMVTDSFSGVGTIADAEGLVLQRCHFHLLGKLATLCGNRKRRITW